MDKYEEAAQEYKPGNTDGPEGYHGSMQDFLANGFRFYEEKYLAKREQETCETCGSWIVTHYSDKHGQCLVLDRYTKSTFGCTEYARRIVEKVQPPEGGAR